MKFIRSYFALYSLISVILLSVLMRVETRADDLRSGVVTSAEFHASEAGAQILRNDGNAIDAAVATALALAVTYPAAGNIGGGGFMVIRLADGRSTTIDYREVAPELGGRNMYLDTNGNLIPDLSTHGIKAAGVPGTVAGLALALKKYGTMKWADVVEPARRLAYEGFLVSKHLASSLKSDKWLTKDPESCRVFQRNGNFYREGEIFKQPELAATLKRIKEIGPDEFYRGETAKQIARFMKSSGGLITEKDLSKYRAIERKPVVGQYRGYTIITMPPPSSGGIVLLQMLQTLESFDMTQIGATSPQHYHLLAEAMRRAFADRSEYFGDPDYVKVPMKGLLDPAYNKSRAQDIQLTRATPSSSIKPGEPQPHESTETTHFSVVDAHGNAVSNTYTLNFLHGSGVTVPGAGFLLNDEMDDFAAKPGAANGFGLIQGEKNAIAPHKRPLSSMTPTIVLKNNKPILVVGSPGGPTIINSVLQVILNIVDHKMSVMEAVNATRMHHQWMPDEIAMERRGTQTSTVDSLKSLGHTVRLQGTIGDVQAIGVDPITGAVTGVSDPRSADGRAVSVPAKR